MIDALRKTLKAHLANRSDMKLSDPSKRCGEHKVVLDSLVGDAVDTELDEEVWESFKHEFLSSGPELLHEATEFLWQYYGTVAGAFSKSERRDYGIPEIDRSADIWDEVRFQHPPEFRPGSGALSPAAGYLSFEGEVSWEPEHGLQLVFEVGPKICKVGPYDGHTTTAHAWGDQSLLGVVYK